jgi:hypothetical protein
VPNAPVATPLLDGRPVPVAGVPKLPTDASAGARLVALVGCCTGKPLGSPKKPVWTGFATGIAGICAGKLGWSTGFGAGGAGTSTVRSTRGVRGAGMFIGVTTTGSAWEETATGGTETRATGSRTGEGLERVGATSEIAEYFF